MSNDDDDAEYLTAESHFKEYNHIVDADSDADYFTAESNFEYDDDDGNDNISGEKYQQCLMRYTHCLNELYALLPVHISR